MQREWSASRVARLVALIAAIGIVGWIDYRTGPEIAMSIFYLFAIAIAGWFGGFPEAFMTAFAGAGCWFAADMAWHPPTLLWISTWNGTTRLVMYIAVGVLTAMLRRDREHLAATNALLERALHVERSISRTDSLTELPNSRALWEKLDRVIEVSRSTSEAVCLALLDVDNFKRVNDIYGHSAADELLRRIAGEIRNAVRGDDFAARIGGDEFVILFREIDPSAAEAVGQRIVETVNAIGQEFPGTDLGVSVGVGVFTGGEITRDGVILRADNAMYEAKAAGKRRVIVFADAPAATSA